MTRPQELAVNRERREYDLSCTRAEFVAQAPEPTVRAFVVDCFRDWLITGQRSEWWFTAGQEQHKWMREHLSDLADRDLACWCPADQPCHADVLLALAQSARPS